MALAELPEALFHLFPIAKPRRIQDTENQVGYFRERRHDDDDLIASLGVLLHEAGRLPNPLGAADRGATEFHHNKTHGNPGRRREIAILVQHAGRKCGKTLTGVDPSPWHRDIE
jgi:hypothetical protein